MDLSHSRLFSSGLLGFPLTPFDRSGEFDPDRFADHLERFMTLDIGAIFVAGGAGELSALSEAEHRRVVEKAVSVVAGRLPVYAGAGGGFGQARSLARTAADAGADGILLLPPYLVGGTSEGQVALVRCVAEVSPLPLIVYRRGLALFNAEQTLRIMDIPNVVGLKDGTGDMAALRRVVAAVRKSDHAKKLTFEFMNGVPTAELRVDQFEALGIHTYSSAVLCFCPEVAVAFYQAVKRGDEQLKRELESVFYKPLGMLCEEASGFAVSLIKAGCRLRGLDLGDARPPLAMPNAEQEARLEAIIEAGLRVVGAAK